ncbi:glycosyltransferase [Psychrobacter submarinus]|uniref:glycosyltransferase n=1 Tax=Psychrobacter submarinus TaxID=154108 RepID=UPI00191941EF|nr:glycosyltransferase [Psychrobacter submarinus]
MSTDNKRKIAIFLPNLDGGGAEKVFVNLSAAFIKQGFAVDMLLIQKKGELSDSLDAKVHIIDIDSKKIRGSFAPLLSYLRNHDPEILIAVMWPLTVIATIAFRLSRCSGRMVVSDHNTLSLSTATNSRSNKKMLAQTIKWIYPLADVRLAVSNGVAADIQQLSGLFKSKFNVIHNPIDITIQSDAAKGNLRGYFRILNVGSLKRQKNQALLIKAFAKLLEHIDAELVIVGEGELRGELEKLIADLNLQHCVTLTGFKKDVAAEYVQSDLFVLSSDYEGFGNVIVEAMSAGVTVVSTDCQSGPREILAEGEYGRLVPVGDADALAKAMLESLQQPQDEQVLKNRAADFSLEKIANQYLDVMFPERIDNYV